MIDEPGPPGADGHGDWVRDVGLFGGFDRGM